MSTVSSGRKERAVEGCKAEPLVRVTGCLPAFLTTDQTMALLSSWTFFPFFALFQWHKSCAEGIREPSNSPTTAEQL